MKTVANEIVVFESGFGGIKDLHQHDNDMGPLHQHPSEGIQKEEVQEKRYGGTGDLEREIKTKLPACFMKYDRRFLSKCLYHKIFYA